MSFLIYLVVGLLFFGIIRMALSSDNSFPRITKNLISAILSIGLSLTLSKYIFLAFFTVLLYEHHPQISFDKESWHSNIKDRHEMSEAIIENQILIGKTRHELSGIIGKPRRIKSDMPDTLSSWTYDMGSESWGLGIKFHYLNINFQNDIVIEVNAHNIID